MFKDRSHEENCHHVLTLAMKEHNDSPYYQAACYLITYSPIYELAMKDPFVATMPFFWALDYLDTTTIAEDQEGVFLKTSYEIKLKDEGLAFSDQFINLSLSDQKLALLGLHLFLNNSSYYNFDIGLALSIWDDSYKNMFYQALEIKSGQFNLLDYFNEQQLDLSPQEKKYTKIT